MQRLSLSSTVLAAAGLLLSMASAAETPAPPAVIPLPSRVQVTDTPGFELTASTPIIAHADVQIIARYAATTLGAQVGTALTVEASTSSGRPPIRLELAAEKPSPSPTSDYRLRVDRGHVLATASTAEGLFYAIQTLRQLSTRGAADQPWTFPAVEIDDAPRFRWRGLLVDVAAHFFPPAMLRRTIDQMALYKLNVLHLHLTDYGGWRIEIPAYPKLATVGARGDLEKPGEGEPRFYSPAEVREIVAYAAERFITVVPEIEMPGHAGAAARAYPEFFCSDGTFNPAAPGVYDFIAAVVAEVARQFPGRYLHFGGDEVSTGSWIGRPDVERFMAAEGLKSPAELQLYFYRRVAKIIGDAGRRPMAWDETAEAGIGGDVTIQWWRKARPDVRDAVLKNGVEMVLSPVDQIYLDYAAGPGEPGSPWEGNENGPTSLEKILRWEPLADAVPAAHAPQVLGIEAALWTQFMRTEAFLEFMLYPRMLAVAEVAWRAPGPRDPAEFQHRLEPQLERLRAQGIRARFHPGEAYPYLIH